MMFEAKVKMKCSIFQQSKTIKPEKYKNKAFNPIVLCLFVIVLETGKPDKVNSYLDLRELEIMRFSYFAEYLALCSSYWRRD